MRHHHLLLALSVTACASSDKPEAPVEEVAPIEDEKSDAAFESTLVGERNEWGEIIRPDEEATFAAMAVKINELQQLQAPSPGAPTRGFHAKVHACTTAELQLDPARPAATRHGLFAGADTVDAPASPLRAWVRFSSGQGRSLADNERDVRGIAIKVMGVEGARLVEDGATTQDFLMTTRAASHVNDAVEFMQFAEAAATGQLAGWALTHPISAARLFRQTAPVKTLVTKYWSGSPYRVGPTPAKLAVWPCNGQPATTQGTTQDDPDYLRRDLQARITTSDVCFELGVQLRKDPANERIEKGSSVWDEQRNPFVRVGRVVIAQRAAGALTADEDYCDDLAFNPWHGLVEHQPLGHLNRARKPVYAASANLRGHVAEPTN